MLVSLDRTSNTLAVAATLAPLRDQLPGRGTRGDGDALRGQGQDKFAPIPWEPTRHGLPVLHEDSIAHVSCDVVEEIEAGDHILFIGCVFEARPPEPDAVPLLYFRRTFDCWPVVGS